MPHHPRRVFDVKPHSGPLAGEGGDAEQLWAEHGWSLDLSDIASLLIALAAAALLIAWYP